MAKRRVAAIVKIQIQAGAATPAPPVGTALGPHGINIMDFCKAYNASTESPAEEKLPMPVTAMGLSCSNLVSMLDFIHGLVRRFCRG